MEFVSKYKSYKPDSNGIINYSAEDNQIWQLLYSRQELLWPERACDEYLHGLEILNIGSSQIPQLPQVSKILSKLTGWQVEAVPALISARSFFELLANKKFPAATFIRVIDELGYVQEPDIFHEIIGHSPMLTNKVYADFMHSYAKFVLQSPESDWPLLQRLFWFTVEVGLIYTSKGLRIYGGGILSSINETVYSVESDLPMRVLFDPLVAFRTPYRIDDLQKVYFVIHDYKELYNFIRLDVAKIIKKARSLGEFPALFAIDTNNQAIHVHAC
jgi:phenylalanine-4-hydroxylase